ncbi:MAG: UDP-3-O-(3-hydroxymyristoyl)glucosamine N-acyltransferase [Rhodocyclaceae bacterium]|nr:UDP-3-O-(3-hydroxymyristoyl)glucosamine N-acyltransferase [Rhodocyclaceae bacterium]
MRKTTLGEIVARFGGQLDGPANTAIHGIATLAQARAGEIAFLANPKYRKDLAKTQASAVIVSPADAALCPVAKIVTDAPYLYYARLSQWMTQTDVCAPGVHASAVVESALPASARVGPQAWIGANVVLGENVVIGAGCCIGPNVVIGDDTVLYPRVTIYHDCRVGRRAILHAGAVVGADGFGFARDGERWVKIAQSGRVIIGDDVEIGANTTIDRGALDDTVIEDGVKLDNQIQIGHNVHIGRDCAFAGCVGVAGSTRFGARCTVGGGAVILGHLRIADDVHISAGTLVTKSIETAGVYTGAVPFLPHAQWQRNFARLRHLDALADRIRDLDARLAALENGNDDDGHP